MRTSYFLTKLNNSKFSVTAQQTLLLLLFIINYLLHSFTNICYVSQYHNSLPNTAISTIAAHFMQVQIIRLKVWYFMLTIEFQMVTHGSLLIFGSAHTDGHLSSLKKK